MNARPSEPSQPPVIRIVRMTFRPDALGAFQALFEAAAPGIRAFPGCQHLELWQDAHYANILTTCSHWESEEALESYRKSALFKATWAETRRLFAAPPQASSYYVRVRNEGALPESFLPDPAPGQL